MQKKEWMLATLAALSLTATTGLLGYAQNGVKVQVGGGAGVQVDTPRTRAVAPRDGEAQRVGNHRASKIVGMAVKNAAGEDLGKIEDLVIDDRGHVRYAAVSFGGFLGFNDKLFAVPFSALSFKANPDSETSHIQLNVEKKLLEKAPGFPKDQWPNFGDVKFHKEVDDFYLKIGGTKVKVDR